jgi:hypothetical protein
LSLQDTGIVDQRGDRAECLLGGIEHPAHRGLISDIGSETKSDSTASDNARNHIVGGALVCTIVDTDLVAGLGSLSCGCCTDAPTSASNNDCSRARRHLPGPVRILFTGIKIARQRTGQADGHVNSNEPEWRGPLTATASMNHKNPEHQGTDQQVRSESAGCTIHEERIQEVTQAETAVSEMLDKENVRHNSTADSEYEIDVFPGHCDPLSRVF